MTRLMHGPVIAIVPARGGSKGIPNKNLQEIGGRSLLGWTLSIADKSDCFDRIIVSTDNDKIGAEAQIFGVETFRRPDELAQDNSMVLDLLRYLHREIAEAASPEVILVLLQPTSPFRIREDITGCVDLLVAHDFDSTATYVEAAHHPERVFEILNGEVRPYMASAEGWRPRQELRPAFHINGAVYAYRPSRMTEDAKGLPFGRSGAVVMPKVRSVDIDDDLDLSFARSLFEMGQVQLP